MTSSDMSAGHGTFTILFTDLEGSTDLRLRAGDAKANQVIDLHDRIVRSHLEAAGATEIKSLGDGFMALFPSANKAIEAAVAIQRGIEEHNASNPDLTMAIRIGLNSGDVAQSPGDAHGTAVHAASRIADKAQGGQILVSQLVNQLAGTLGDTKTVDRGLFWLKGFPERWRLYEVMWRERETERVTRDIKAASAAAFDAGSPRVENPVVGRAKEQAIVTDQLLATASSGLRALVLEGEAGIGKTRMLEATSDLAESLDQPYWVLYVSADEELRGPFLLFRSLLASPRTASIAREAMALEQLDRAQEAISGRGERDGGLSPQEQVLRTFDEVASAVSALTRERPLVLMLDDLQWADEDSIQLIRYLVRTLASAPLFLLISIRPYSTSGGAGKLIADLDRMHVTQVLRLQRLTRLETGQLLQVLLGAPVDEQTLHSFHARSEGVPFFIEELARAYREAEALQLIDGTWTMTRLSGPAVPSSIQSLIERRLAQLDDDCRSLLADAGVLGRKFNLQTLSDVLAKVRNEEPKPAWQLGEELEKAVDIGLLTEEPEGSSYDLSFSHDQIRKSLLEASSRQRQRAIHAAIAESLAAKGDDQSLSMLAFHALKAGDSKQAVTAAVDAAKAALRVYAPEESVRIIDATLPAASQPEDRISMLKVKDDALAILDRPMDRIANLAEMTALTSAVAIPGLDVDVQLRRASAARANQDFEHALELAESLVATAKESGDRDLELAARLELGQAMTRSPIGEGYFPVLEVDLNQAEATYQEVLELARELGARRQEADALREMSVIEAGLTHKRAKVVEDDEGLSKLELVQRAPEFFARAKDLAEEALHIYEEIGDKRGAMSALISMAYSHVTDPTARGMAGRMEHIRMLHHQRKGEVTESQRAVDDALMLYSIHTFARLNLQPDLALERGRQAFEAARSLGNRWLECLAAGGVAMTHASLKAAEECDAWLDRAAGAAMAVASTAMSRRLEMWRGEHAAVEGDFEGMVRHLERAAELAGQKNPAGRCQAHSTLAIRSARLAAQTGEAHVLERARRAATDTFDSIRSMSGRLPWACLGHAALAVSAQTEGDMETAVEEVRQAMEIDGDTYPAEFLDVLWAAARILIPSGQPEAAALTAELYGGFSYLAMSIGDEKVRKQWFDAHSELTELVGFDLATAWKAEDIRGVELTDGERSLLRDLATGVSQTAVEPTDMSRLLEKIGAGSETEAIEFAIKAGVTWR